MCGAGKFQPAAHDGAVQDRDDRYTSELDLLEGGMPHARVHDAFAHVAFADLAQIEAGTEMIAFAAENHRTDHRGKRGEGRLQIADQLIADGIALGRAVQADVRDRPIVRDGEKARIECGSGGRRRAGCHEVLRKSG